MEILPTWRQAAFLHAPMPLTVLHFLTDLDRDSGGPSVSVPALCRALAGQPGLQVALAARSTPGAVDPGTGTGFSVSWTVGSRHGVETLLDEAMARSDWEGLVLHLHGLWDPLYLWAAMGARRRGIPYAVSIRGMLEPWALRHKRTKKRLAWHLYQRKILLGAALLHATSPEEEASIRHAGLSSADIAVLPNGVEPPPPNELPPKRAARRPEVLFLGRIHPIKGLEILLQAWATAAPAGWTLRLAGPDADGHRSSLEALARRLDIAERVVFSGPLQGREKWTALAGASCLVLPSFSENFGMVVAEALAAGTPVATSTGTPWQAAETAGAGWRFDPEPSSLARVLDDLGTTSADELDAMGSRGKTLVEAHYGWPSVAECLAGHYRRMAEGRRRA